MRASPIIALFLSVVLTSEAAGLSGGQSDTTRRKLEAAGVISVNSNGIASIPAFSLNDPALMSSIVLRKGRFSYEPFLAYGFDMRPWYIDNWMRFRWIDRPRFEFRTGFNISSFFTKYRSMEEEFLKGERYYAIELTAVYRFSRLGSLTMAYWRDMGQEKESIKGHFFSLSADYSGIRYGKAIFSASFQLFNISYDGANDGLFVAPRIAAAWDRFPVSVFAQGTQPLVSNIRPWPGFKWNAGIAYTF